MKNNVDELEDSLDYSMFHAMFSNLNREYSTWYVLSCLDVRSYC